VAVGDAILLYDSNTGSILTKPQRGGFSFQNLIVLISS